MEFGRHPYRQKMELVNDIGRHETFARVRRTHANNYVATAGLPESICCTISRANRMVAVILDKRYSLLRI